MVSETYSPDTPAFISVTYQHDAVNHIVNAVTVTARRDAGARHIGSESNQDMNTKLRLSSWRNGASVLPPKPKTYGKVEFVHRYESQG